MCNYDYYPRKSPHAHHGAACSKNGMTKWFRFLGQTCAHICPSPQSSLATGPRFIRLEAWLHEEVTWLKGGDSLRGAKTAGFSIKVQTPAPQGEKLSIDQDDHRTGEFGSENPPWRRVRWRMLVSSRHHPHPSHKLHLHKWRRSPDLKTWLWAVVFMNHRCIIPSISLWEDLHVDTVWKWETTW